MSRKGIDRRHCKWPLGHKVWVLTPDGYLEGSIHRHQRERPNGCDVCFSRLVDLGDLNGARSCHYFPFRSLRRSDPWAVRLKRPWYREDPYNGLVHGRAKETNPTVSRPVLRFDPSKISSSPWG